jgi:hypothetical protein
MRCPTVYACRREMISHGWHHRASRRRTRFSYGSRGNRALWSRVGRAVGLPTPAPSAKVSNAPAECGNVGLPRLPCSNPGVASGGPHQRADHRDGPTNREDRAPAGSAWLGPSRGLAHEPILTADGSSAGGSPPSRCCWSGRRPGCFRWQWHCPGRHRDRVGHRLPRLGRGG